jgi:hypothetical protein
MDTMISLDRSRHSFCLLFLSVAVTLLAVVPVEAEDQPGLSYFQGLVGAAGFDEDKLTFVEQDPNNPGAVSQNDLSTMPYLGVAGQYALAGGKNHIGIDGSLLFGWRSDDSSFHAGNGQVRVDIDSDLWLIDMAIGLYAQTLLGDRVRLYGAVGPMMLFGEYSDDKTEEDLSVTPTTENRRSNSESAFGVGGYAKLGFEYRIYGDAFMGIAVRGIATNLEFDQAEENGGLTGIQGFVTFTRAY